MDIYTERKKIKQASQKSQLQYKDFNAQMMFSPITQLYAKNNYGGQLDITKNKIATNKGSFKFTQQQDKMYDKVTDYIHKFDDPIGRVNIFKSNLKLRIQQARQQMEQFNLQQISEFFPWVMSCNMIFQPFRTIVYALHKDITTQQAQKITGLPAHIINQGVNHQILQSVKNTKKTIQIAMNVFQATQHGWISEKWNKWLNVTKNVGQAFLTAAQAVAKFTYNFVTTNIISRGIATIANYVIFNPLKVGWSGVKGLFTQQGRGAMDITQQLAKTTKVAMTTQKDQDGSIKKYLSVLLKQIFSQLRCYGEIVINFRYLKYAANKRVINGVQIFYFSQYPDIAIGLKNSLAQVYTVVNGNLVLIPQGIFNIQYLRKLLRVQMLRFTARLYDYVDRSITLTQQQRQPLETFNKAYCNWKTKKAIDLYDLKTQINNQKTDDNSKLYIQKLQQWQKKKRNP